MNLKGILFDFNGTLLFDSDMHMEAFRRVFPLFGKPVPTDEAMLSFFGATNRGIYSKYIDPYYTEEELHRFIELKERAYLDICLEMGETFRLADGAREMLDYIADKEIPYCLATGSERKNVEFYMEHLELGKWFELDRNLIYEDGSFMGKPEPDIYLLAAKRLGLIPSECLVFEDAPNGILAARRAGVGAIVAVYDEKYPSPQTEEARADREYHDHLNWKKTLADYGLTR